MIVDGLWPLFAPIISGPFAGYPCAGRESSSQRKLTVQVIQKKFRRVESGIKFDRG